MSRPNSPAKSALIVALMISKGFDPEKAISDLKENFGKIEEASALFDFEYTDYYNGEMGDGIQRGFTLFKNLVKQGDLAEIKMITNKIEKKYSINNRRRVNLDPGILSSSRFVLATGKDAPHRIYLKNGIFADLTLVFQSGAFLSQPWTYPDYSDEKSLEFLSKCRKIYLSKLKADR